MAVAEPRVDSTDVREATPEEGRAIIDAHARQLLGVSGEEFLRRWDAGEYEDTEDPNVNAVAILISFAR
ncbi:MAG: hypothetical protein ABIS21_05325 [Acidimicrobiales bacterium]